MRCEPRGWCTLASILVPVAGCTAIEPAGDRDARVEPPSRPRYECPWTGGPIVVDGRIDEPAWSAAPWTGEFVDIEGDIRPAPRFRTRAKMLWDDEHLYVAAELEEPHVWGTLTEHDSIIYQDNDFEVFIDPDGDSCNYYEVEVNPLNTIFDLFLARPYSKGGKARIRWNWTGLRSAVHVDGTLGDPRDVDHGWSVEIALPFSALGPEAGRPRPPRPGDMWRINFSRVQWRHRVVDGRYEKVPDTPEDNWVWTVQGEVNMHVPERWGELVFLSPFYTLDDSNPRN